MSSRIFLASALVASVSAAPPAVPTVALGNAAVPGLLMPAVGLGTGAYSVSSPRGTCDRRFL